MASLDDLFTALQNGVTAINNLTTQVRETFPQVSALSTTVPSSAGVVTFNSSRPSTFLTVVTSSGGTYQVPLYL